MQYSEEYLVVHLIIIWLVIKGRPSSYLMPSIFSPVCISSNSLWGCAVYSSNTDPTPISVQYLLGKRKAVPL